MPNNPFKLPGSDLLRLGDSFLPGGRNNPQAAPKDKPPAKPKDTGLGQGGGGGRRKPAEPTPDSDLEAMDMTPAEEPVEEKPKEPEAILSEGAWAKPDTLFHEEAEVTVKVVLPPGKEHITRVGAELYAKTPSGPELISKAEGNAGADGKATLTLATFLPKHFQGEAIEHFVVFTHKLAKAFKPESILRKIQDLALKSADHILVPGIVFERNTSFIRPQAADGMKALETKLKDWEKKYPKGKIVIFGHANPDEEYGKLLSERRAQSAYAFITNDADTWEKLYHKEKWGIKAIQYLLKDLGIFDEAPVDKHGPKTTAALKAFQNKVGLEPNGQEDPATRKALFSAYMKGKHDIKIDAGRFRVVGSNPWMGCSANNRAKAGDKPAPENRRVAFILVNESKVFPVNFPCQDREEAGCAGQCRRPGKRSAPGNKCAFYDELVREEKQAPVTEDDAETGNGEKFDRASFNGFEGKGYVIKDFKKYQGKAIQVNPEKIHDGGEDVPDDLNNQCVSFVRFFGLPQTSTWGKGPRVCDLKPGDLQEGTVVATMRDGVYHTDGSGRSHVGIYLSHDDYEKYSSGESKSAAVKMMDQWKGAIIDSREKRYSTDADKESSRKYEWKDIDGTAHHNRTNWINDGEEYFVVLTP